MNEIRLTQFSSGAGCGCKISPGVLGDILKNEVEYPVSDKLLVGNSTKDDAAVYDIGNGKAIISTTDFFTPIVDDPYDFGRIAAVNAISDVFAMGGMPILAIAILGWPLDKLSPEVARKVIAGAKSVCAEIGITLAGGHSIDISEPVFGLAVNGLVDIKNIKQNNTATKGSRLFLTKPLGVGILATAEKKSKLKEEHKNIGLNSMTALNKIGFQLGELDGVTAMTDVTGFGLLGHLVEMCEGSGVDAVISFKSVPKIDGLDWYIKEKCCPGGTFRNWKSYGDQVGSITDVERMILCDPQTSGGLLVAVEENGIEIFKNKVFQSDVQIWEIGILKERTDNESPYITVN